MVDFSLTEPSSLRYYNIMTRQQIDIGDLVECDLGNEKMTGVILDRKAINPNYNINK